jgi:predicted lipoprotein with Yx(FWY)xxD motif
LPKLIKNTNHILKELYNSKLFSNIKFPHSPKQPLTAPSRNCCNLKNLSIHLKLKRMLLTLKKGLMFFGLAGVVFLSACSASNGDMAPADPAGTKGLQLSDDAKFGNIFIDGASGKTLYFFAPDADGNSACTGGCLAAWPAFYAGDTPVLPSGIDPKDIGTITRPEGGKQSTYKGWAMYTFVNDKAKGDVTGDGVEGVWFVAKPDYSVMLASKQLVGLDGKNYKADGTAGDGATIYLTGSGGRTLYAFVNDTFNTNKFTAADLSNDALWPMYQSTVMRVPSILKDQVTQTTSAGKTQLVFKGRPAYYFGQDGATSRGVTKGVSIKNWLVLHINTTALTPAN